MSLCRFLAFCHDFIVFIFKLCDVHNGARKHLCISSIVDAVFAHHLTDHDFNVFIVDFNALGFIDTEYLLHEVVTRSGRPADTQDIVRIEGPFSQAVAHFHMIAVGNMKFGPIWNMVGIFRAIFAGDDDKTAIFLFLDADGSCRFAEDTRMFRFPCFEELFDTRKTLGNIVSTGNAARMERTHRELGARFPDGLGGNGPDSFADFDLAGRGEVAAIALAADAKVGFAGKNAADLDFFTEAGDDISHIFRNIVIDVIKDVTVLVFDFFGKGSAHEAVAEDSRTVLLFLPAVMAST